MMESEKNSGESSREALEKQAFELRTEGRILFALEILEEAIKLDEQWYHFFYKAIWLYDAKRISDAAQVMEYGLNLGKGKEFYFAYLSADLLLRAALASANNLTDIDKAIKELADALMYVNRAASLLLHNREEIETSKCEIPDDLKQLWPTFINVEDLSNEVLGLRTRIEIIRQSIILFKGIMDTENRVNAAIDRNRERIDSERVRTIELLGIFTAILAFIFSGVQLFTRLPFFEALVLQGGMALIMIIFFISVHLITEPEARTKSLIGIFVILIIVLLGLPFYGGFLNKIRYLQPKQDISIAGEKSKVGGSDKVIGIPYQIHNEKSLKKLEEN